MGSRGVTEPYYEYTYEAITRWFMCLFKYFTFLDRTLQLNDVGAGREADA